MTLESGNLNELDWYDFDLPRELIAQEPLSQRFGRPVAVGKPQNRIDRPFFRT